MENLLSYLQFTDSVVERLRELGYDDTDSFEDDVLSHHADYRDEHPSVYCGSYHKYASGSLGGMWIDLTTFDSFAYFNNFCQAIHADEADCEPMFQDYECFPRELYSESGFSQRDWNALQDYIEACEKHDKDAVDAFVAYADVNSLGSFEDCYQGKWDSEEDFAEHIVEECYFDDLNGVSDLIRNNIDWKGIARELFMCDYYFDDGHVFCHNY